MELRHLRYFVAVSEELHFGQAAARLGMSQPPLSQAIRRLEHELGVRLLDRTSRSVRPTEAGEAFAVRARRVLADIDVAVEEARHAAGRPSALRVGCVPSAPLERLQRFLSALEEADVAVRAAATSLPASEQLRRLRAGDLDLGVIYAGMRHSRVETETLYEGEFAEALLWPGHPLADAPVLRPEDLRAETRVALAPEKEYPLHAWWRARLDATGYRFSDTYETGSDPRDVILAVIARQGIALLPPSMLAATGAEHLAEHRPLDPPVRFADLSIAWATGSAGLGNGRIETARDVARRLHAES